MAKSNDAKHIKEKKKKGEKSGIFTNMIGVIKNIKDFLSHVFVILLFILFIFFVFKDSRKTTFYIESFSTTKDFDDKGLNGENLASILKNEINKIRYIDAAYAKKSIHFIDSKRKDYDVKDPITGFNVSKLKDYIQDVAFGNTKEISGFITTLENDEKQLYVRLEDKFLSLYKFKDVEDVDSIIQIVAEDFIRLHEDKYILGVHYLTFDNNIEKCFKIIHELLNDNDESNDYKAYQLRGSIYLKNSANLDLAEKDFNEVVERAPNPARAINNLGLIFEKRSKEEKKDTTLMVMNIDKAINNYKKVTIIDTTYSKVFLHLGNSYMHKYTLSNNKLLRDTAELYYREFISLNRDEIIGYISLGNSLYEVNKQEALKIYDKATQIDPFNSLPYLQLAMRYHADGANRDALDYINKAIENYKNDSTKYLGIGNYINEIRRKINAALSANKK
ncbi:tetratricopeptide repeat protein [Chondrinema litorale]|uniref:tetratricopeptide repeat protein n=1 Tax=Chondrinema litorale TaxID=2994555 RepID=UPI002543C827|nr:hypothetical protein [Chondrinema litorale]UZR93151.1 hypothetical protein OQ292_14925 [Chondrinema litorale]